MWQKGNPGTAPFASGPPPTLESLVIKTNPHKIIRFEQQRINIVNRKTSVYTDFSPFVFVFSYANTGTQVHEKNQGG